MDFIFYSALAHLSLFSFQIPFSVEAINRGTLIALKLVDMDTVKYVLCSIASPNNGRDPDHEDDWELSCEGLSNRFASADFMRIVPKKGYAGAKGYGRYRKDK